MKKIFMWLVVIDCALIQASDSRSHTPVNQIRDQGHLVPPHAPVRPVVRGLQNNNDSGNNVRDNLLNRFNQVAGNVGNPNIEADPDNNFQN